MGRELASDLVSILTPIRGDEKLVRETIQSAQAQTYWHWEMLALVEAGSPLADLVRGLAAGDARIRVIDASALAIEQARGRFVAFLEIGDTWAPTKLDQQLKVVREMHAGLSYTGFRWAGGREFQVPEQITYFDLLKANRIGRSTAVIDQTLAGPLRLDSGRQGDYLLWLKTVKDTGAAEGVQEELASIRSQSPANLLMAGGRWRVYRQAEGLSLGASLFYSACSVVNALARRTVV